VGLDLALGPLTDKPTRRWDELFIPAELHDALSHVKRNLNGNELPLVRAERELLSAERAPVRADPPSRSLAFGAVGTALGLGLFALGRAARRSRRLRACFGMLCALLGLLLGLLGSVFVVFWAFTKHWSAYRNENILVCPPFALILLVAGLGLSLRRKRATRLAFATLRASAACAALGLALALIPGFGQDNTRIAALLAPLWFGLYAGAAALSERPLWPLAARVQRAAAGESSPP